MQGSLGSLPCRSDRKRRLSRRVCLFRRLFFEAGGTRWSSKRSVLLEVDCHNPSAPCGKPAPRRIAALRRGAERSAAALSSCRFATTRGFFSGSRACRSLLATHSLSDRTLSCSRRPFPSARSSLDGARLPLQSGTQEVTDGVQSLFLDVSADLDGLLNS